MPVTLHPLLLHVTAVTVAPRSCCYSVLMPVTLHPLLLHVTAVLVQQGKAGSDQPESLIEEK